MKTIKIKLDKKLKIIFVNNHGSTHVEIEDPPSNFIIPRIGEQFEFSKDGRTNIVDNVYHDLANNEVFIYYDFYLCYHNRTLGWNEEGDRKAPDENYDAIKQA